MLIIILIIDTVIFLIKKYTDNHKKLWDDYVSKAKNATFLFQRDFMEYHSDRFQDFSLLIFEDEKLKAIIPANRVGDTLYSHQGLSYGGIVVDKTLKLSQFIPLFKSVLEYINAEGLTFFNIKPIPSIYTNLPSDEINYLLFLVEAKLIQRNMLSVIDNSKQSIKFSTVRKRGHKKAEANGLVIKEESNFEVFWKTVLIPNLQNRFAIKPVHSVEEIKKLHYKFSKNIRQFNVYKDEEIVAGATIFETDTVAHAQYISATTNRQELGSIDFLFNYLIKDTFKTKAFFDFGTSIENNAKNINAGLLYWKESFGARTIMQDMYTIETKNHNLLNNVML